MSINNTIKANAATLKEMAANCVKFKINPSKQSGDLRLSSTEILKVDVDQTPENWKVFDMVTGNMIGQETVNGAPWVIMDKFMNKYRTVAVGKSIDRELERLRLERQGVEEKTAPEADEDSKPAEIAKIEYNKPDEIKNTHTKKAKHNSKAKTEESPGMFGMELPIAYPPEMKGQSIKFKQWKKVNNVFTAESKVLILDEDAYNFTVNIPSARLGFTICRDKVEIINSV